MELKQENANSLPVFTISATPTRLDFQHYERRNYCKPAPGDVLS
jgi:hypothetical protein